jgi:hypothetical protein
MKWAISVSHACLDSENLSMSGVKPRVMSAFPIGVLNLSAHSSTSVAVSGAAEMAS